MIRSRNSDNSGTTRAQRIRWQSAAGGPKVRTNIGSMALDGILWNQGVFPQDGTIGPVETGSEPGPGSDTVPDAPTSISAEAGINQATISFTPPINNGGSVILSYTVTSNPGGVTATDSASPIVVTGLTDGVTYTFTVVATNAIGSSSPSSASNPVTPGVLLRRMVYRSGTRTWKAPTDVSLINYLLVAGGGGGGGSYDTGAGGGGGGGLVLTGTASVTPGQSYTCVIGAGGVGGVGVGNGGGDGLATGGGNSSFDTITATGGGLGYGSLDDRSGAGGSQGNAGTLTSPTGGKGGRITGTINNAFGAGGGGGMGSAGTTAVAATNAAGGSGIVSDITGSNVTYGAGGSGGRVNINANGGSAAANTGNGGNGSSSISADGSTGGNGGSGLVVLTYYGPVILPLAPAITQVQLADVFFIVYFTQDMTNGANDITNYEFSTDGGATFLALSPTDAASPITIIKRSDTGGALVANTTYQFQLRALNIDGTGVACSNYSVKTMTYAKFSRFTSVGTTSWTAPSDTTITQYIIVGGGGGSGGAYSNVLSVGTVPLASYNGGGQAGYWINSDTTGTGGTFYGYMFNGTSLTRFSSSIPVRMTLNQNISPAGSNYVYNKWYAGELVYWVSNGFPYTPNYYPPYTVNSTTNNNVGPGSGGGAGGQVQFLNPSQYSVYAVDSNASYTVTVGDGGSAGTAGSNTETAGGAGGSSVFATITSLGGSGGSGSHTASASTNGFNSGGGGGQNGSSQTSSIYGGNGGQGSLTAGSSGNGETSGSGGLGRSVNFDGTGSVSYGAGASGGTPNTVVTSSSTDNVGVGAVGTGSTINSYASGNKGGSGIVIIKYWTDEV